MKLKIFTFSLLSFLVFVPIVSAKISLNTPQGVSNSENAKTEIQNRKEEINLRITAVKRERIMSHFGKMQVRLEVIVQRIEILIGRIETRIEKIDALTDENKIDTTEAKNDLAEAKSKLAEIKILVEKLTIEDTLSSETPKESFLSFRDDVKLIKDSLKEVHLLLVKTIGDLRGLRVGDTINEE